MNNKEVLKIVDNTYDKKKKIEQNHQTKKKQFERKVASTVIDVSEMYKAEAFISEAFNLLRKLYADYTALVVAVDDLCRPYIDELDTATIGTVAILFKEIQKEINESSASFSAEFSGLKNEIATVTTSSCLAVDFIVNLWNDRFQLAPDHKEAKKQIEKRKAAIQKKKLDEEKTEKDELKKEIEFGERNAQEIKQQNVSVDAFLKQCKKTVDQFEKNLMRRIQKTKDTLLKDQADTIRSLNEELAKNEMALQSAGLFAFALRKEIKATIASLKAKIEKTSAPSTIDVPIDILTQKATNAVAAYRKTMDEYINQRFTATEIKRTVKNPKATRRKALKASSREKEKIEAAKIIVEQLSFDKKRSLEDLFDTVMYEMINVSPQTVRNAFSFLVNERYIEKETIDEQIYYSIISETIQVTDTVWKEIPETKDLPCPVPPTVDLSYTLNV